MTTIPKPSEEKTTGEDNATKFLIEWKRLFNNIDLERIRAYIEGDNEFIKFKNSFSYKATRLDGACNTKLQLIVNIDGHFQHLSFPCGHILCCLTNQAYSTDWITELDENLDMLTSTPVPWEFVYDVLVSETKTFKNRIQEPPKVE